MTFIMFGMDRAGIEHEIKVNVNVNERWLYPMHPGTGLITMPSRPNDFEEGFPYVNDTLTSGICLS